MKILYLDPIGGISGDMIVAALVSLGVDFNEVTRELAKMRLRGFRLEKRLVRRGHIRALKFDCLVDKNQNYSFAEIRRIIDKSRISGGIKDNILAVYKTLAAAERLVHGHPHRDIRFHQLGDLDSIVDITAACVCVDRLGVDSIYYPVLPVASKISAAAFRLLLNKDIYFSGQLYENLTPTGVAFLAALGRQDSSGKKNIFKAAAVGYGAGEFDPADCSNVLRAILLDGAHRQEEIETVYCIEANIDDMNPQFFDQVFDRLFAAGALDVFLENVVMKKTRPGFLLTVLSQEHDLDKLAGLILGETTTSGVRFYTARRLKIQRQVRKLRLWGETVAVKLFWPPGGGLRVMPEYDDCKLLALKTGRPVAGIYREVQKKAENRWHSRV